MKAILLSAAAAATVTAAIAGPALARPGRTFPEHSGEGAPS